MEGCRVPRYFGEQVYEMQIPFGRDATRDHAEQLPVIVSCTRWISQVIEVLKSERKNHSIEGGNCERWLLNVISGHMPLK